MKTILTKDNEIKRVSNEDAEEIVRKKEGNFCPKHLWKELRNKKDK